MDDTLNSTGPRGPHLGRRFFVGAVGLGLASSVTSQATAMETHDDRSGTRQTPLGRVDLRSDLLGPHSEAVTRAVSNALTEPSAFDTGESPHEARLVSVICEMLGLEAGVFLPTCTMANQVAVRTWLHDGGNLAGDSRCHVFTAEARGLQLMGIGAVPVDTVNGHVTPQAAKAFVDAADPQRGLVWLENTHNAAGGTVMPMGWQEQIGATCSKAGMAVHLDGSRLWNAAVANGVDLSAVAKGASSISLSLNKALGAPMGAVLAGPKAFIESATGIRAAVGGNWRPIGAMAAGAVAAIPEWRERLQRHHQTTLELAIALKEEFGDAAVASPATNLLLLRCAEGKAREIAASAEQNGARVLPFGPSKIRLAVHGGLARADIPRVVRAVASAWQGGGLGAT